MSSGVPSAFSRPPTSKTVSGGTTRRVARVNRPSTMDTRTTAPSSRTTHSVSTSSVSASGTRFPVRVSIRRTRNGRWDPGTSEPTWIRTWAGSSTRDRTEVLPSETICATSTRSGGRDSNRWVHWHTRQRAVPCTGPEPVRRVGSIRKTRWGVSAPQLSHHRAAACSRGVRAAGAEPEASGPSSGSGAPIFPRVNPARG